MSKDLHIYLNGLDQLSFTLGDIEVHVHAGAPAEPESPETPAASGAPSSPAKTVLISPYAGIVESSDFDDVASLGQLLKGHRHLLIRTAAWTGDQDPIETVIGGLGGAGEVDIAVHIVDGESGHG